MSRFLSHVVCTPMDKADDTSVFQCPKMYVTSMWMTCNMVPSGDTYEDVATQPDALLQKSSDSVAKFGLGLPSLAVASRKVL